MAKAKDNKQPIDDPQLKEEVDQAVGDAVDEAKSGNVSTADSPDVTVEVQGHSHLNP